MIYVVKESADSPGEWIAGAVQDPPEGDGDIYQVIFSGPAAQARARDYAEWENALALRSDRDRVHTGLSL
jgi:hypothetical protein